MKKVEVPTDFRNQVAVVKEMLSNDVSGLVDSLTDFSVQSASVNYGIETPNDTLNATLKKWLKKINISYLGKIFPGIDAVAEEYYKERWKYSSFPVLKVGGWERIDGLKLPTKLLFLDGASIYAQEKTNTNKLDIFSYDYFLGNPVVGDKSNLLDKNVIITNPYGRIHDKYPIPFLIKRGIYANFTLLLGIKNKQSELLEQIMPYLFLVKKGSDELAKNKIKTYSDDDLKATLAQFQKLMENLTTSKAGDKTSKTPTRVTNYDEELKHLIPDMENMFKAELTAGAEKGILTGMGFIDIAEAVSTSRRESILNPKVFIEDTKKAVKDFKSILNSVMLLVWQENDSNTKFKNLEYKIVSTPITSFMTDDFKQELRLLWKHGQLSNQTYAETVGEVDYSIEKKRREQEAKDGTEIIMYPHYTENQEQYVSFDENQRDQKLKNKPKQTEEENGTPIPEDKLDDQEAKDKYTLAKTDLITAPYKTINDISHKIRNSLSPDLRKTFMEVFNNAYKTYGNEVSAFRITWNLIRQIARRDKKGVWVRKRKRIEGKLKPVQLTRGMLEQIVEKENKIIEKAEQSAIHDTLALKKLELIEVELEKSKVQTKFAKKLLKQQEDREKSKEK